MITQTDHNMTVMITLGSRKPPAGCSTQTPSELANALWGPRSGYDKDTRPTVAMAARVGNYSEQPPDVVFVQLQLFAVTEVLAKEGSFIADLWERTIWWDPRLRYNTTCFKPRWQSGAYERYGYHESFAYEHFDRLWTPGTFVSNLREKEIVLQSMFWVEASGRVWHTRKVRWKLGCDFNFRWMPYDTQPCAVEIKSFRYPTFEVSLSFWGNQWNAEGVASNLAAKPHPTRLPPCVQGGTPEFLIDFDAIGGYYPGDGGGALGSNIASLMFVFPLVRKPQYYEACEPNLSQHPVINAYVNCVYPACP
jgi:hypothetical protein